MKNYISDIIVRFCEEENIDDPQKSNHITDLLLHEEPFFMQFREDLRVIIIREFLGSALLYKGSIIQAQKLIAVSKKYFDGIITANPADVYVFEDSAFFVKTGVDVDKIEAGIMKMRKHRERLSSIPDSLRKLVMKRVFDGFSFVDESITLCYLGIIEQNIALLSELPNDVAESILTMSSDFLGINYAETYPSTYAKHDLLAKLTKLKWKRRNILDGGVLPTEQIDSLFNKRSDDVTLSENDLNTMFKLIGKWKTRILALKPSIRTHHVETMLSSLTVNGSREPSFLDGLYTLSKECSDYERNLETTYDYVASIFGHCPKEEYLTFMIQSLLDRRHVFQWNVKVFEELLMHFNVTYRSEWLREHWPDPFEFLDRTLEIVDYGKDLIAGLGGEYVNEAINGLFTLATIRPNDANEKDGLFYARCIIDFVSNSQWDDAGTEALNHYIKVVSYMAPMMGQDTERPLAELYSVFTKSPSDLLKEGFDEDDAESLQELARQSEDDYLYKILDSIERLKGGRNIDVINDNVIKRPIVDEED